MVLQVTAKMVLTVQSVVFVALVQPFCYDRGSPVIHKTMAATTDDSQKRKRVAVDVSLLSPGLDDDALRELLGVPEDVWALMPDSQKVLIFTQRGIDASMAALQKISTDQND